MNKKALVELAKSFGRAVWFGLLGVVAAALTALATDGAVLNAQVEIAGSTVNLGVLLVAVIGFIVKAIDRYRHESTANDSNGIAPSFLQN